MRPWISKLIILEGFRQNGHHHWIQRIVLRIIAPVKIDFRFFFRLWYFFDIRIIKHCIKLMFWRLGTMLERIVQIEKLRIAYIKAEIGTGKHIYWCFEDDCMVMRTVCCLCIKRYSRQICLRSWILHNWIRHITEDENMLWHWRT